MKLAIFDLDHTLIDIDSDYNWGKYIVDNGICDDAYQQKNHDYFELYLAGELHPVEYTEFVGGFLAQHDLETLHAWRADYIKTRVVQHIRPKGLEALRFHQEQGHEIVISSATNDFIVNAVAAEFNVPSTHVIASKLEQDEHGYTGKIGALPNFTTGKVTNLKAWLENKPAVTESWGYSDSFNDIPLLEFADHAYAISADDTLNAHAEKNNWHIQDWSI